ncbi:alveolin domain containing intermediate filament IMC4, putative [Babesia ovata]|uniref:Alveolin domain containing intermediate filament IMC4, putative n=1 Tax=Babesia ovata TaxID=189622 RepID=A0A2H6KDX0_9APIC|nr:alveolin domain containing intermediate filament IMC4, putative [Babesia ovata]GBE61192.1 alveolin domain containing intermediate filament IMC4, putative [Babesia ovata]
MPYPQNGQMYSVQDNVGMGPSADEMSRFFQGNPFTSNVPPQKVKKNKATFPASLCCCCCCEEDVSGQAPIPHSNKSIILKPIRRERIVEVMREEVQERVINVPQVQYVDKFVEVPKPIFKYKMKEVKRPVMVEKIKRVPKIVEEEKIIEVPEIRYVEKEVMVPHIIKRERIVEVPLPVVRERRIPVLKLRKNETYQEVDNVNYNEFGTAITSVREGAEAPNNTPIKRKTESGSNDDKLVVESKFYKETERSHITKQVEEVVRTTKPSIAEKPDSPRHHSPRQMQDLAQTQQTKEVKRWLQNMNEVKQTAGSSERGSKQLNPGVNAGSVGLQEIPFEQLQLMENNGDIKHSITVTEIVSGRETHRHTKKAHDTYVHDIVIENIGGGDIPGDYHMHEEQQDDTVSIYPNIDALSITSNSSDAHRHKQQVNYTGQLRTQILTEQRVANGTSKRSDNVCQNYLMVCGERSISFAQPLPTQDVVKRLFNW